jgi:dihydropteroate synthase
MNYREAATFLFGLRRFRMKHGTDSTERLLSRLGDPHQGGTFVQIAGSNGKGSTARMTESVLREAGLDVGLYTSPHIDDVRERVRVNGHAVPESAVTAFVTEIAEYVTDRAADGMSPTFFEVLTALALWHFDREDVDVAVLEVGIGGRHDATSVVDPAASAVTGVSLEHTDVLGDSIGEIARDTAHVAPEDAPLVTATDGGALEAVRSVAGDVRSVGEENANGTDVTVVYGGLTDRFEGEVSITGDGIDVETRLPLPGAHQATNAGIAAALAGQIADIDDTTVASGLSQATWQARFEVIDRDPLVVLDGAHNPGACAALAETVDEVEYDDLALVVGAMHDKDHAGMADALPTPDRVYTCAPALDRAEDPDVLSQVYERQGVSPETEHAVESALHGAIADAGTDDCVLVTGSLYTTREARTRYTRLVVPRRHRNRADAERTLERAHVGAAATRRARDRSVHRTVTTRLRSGQATVIRERLHELGGACAVSGIEDGEERVEVVLSGTLAQFDRLIEALSGEDGLVTVAADLRDALEAGGVAGDDGGGETAGSDGDTGTLDDGNAGAEYPWESGTAVMGILNVTPDSFHDGGEYNATADAIARAEQMLADGADIIDVGGESTRPGADPVTTAEETDRVVPVIERLADVDALVSVDTRKAAVAKAALSAGADIVNDVSGLEDPKMRHVVAEHDAMVVVMHSLSAPVDPDREVDYDDVVTDVLREVRETVLLAETAGIDRERIIVDPGVGFGKSAAESFALLGRIGEFEALGCPVMLGHSHKSMFGVIGETSGDCLEATIAGTTIAAERGADIVRVHDVAENVPAVRAVEQANERTR